MDTVFKFLFEFLGQFFGSLWSIITGLFGGVGNAFDFSAYVNIINAYTTELGGLAWVIAIIAIVLLVAVLALCVWLIVVAVKKFIRSHRRRKDTDSLVKEVQALNKEVMRLNLEKDKILSMKVSQIGLNPNEISELTGEEIESLNNGEEEDTGESRFYKLTEIDQLWADYVPPVYDNDITLPEFCERFRLFACSQLGLYYDIKLIRLFVAAFASTRLIILQGISGTGKTSLAYAFGKFVNNPSIVASVQPSWRDRTELFGYFNEFTKKFNETELLRAMYEASYNENIYAVILDEMNIARVEYYFAEMLSILEMPSRDEWVVDIIPNSWPSDPKHIVNGQLKIPPNMWYIGTANNDDSTFAITDKVYDRAMPINIDTKGVAFDAPLTDPVYISYKHFEYILNAAKVQFVVSEENLKKIALLDDYVIEHFRIAFGNRIVKQLRDFVPAYVGTGDEWVVDIIPNSWPSDPKHIVNGQLKIPPNMWYIGTANNDDSTFAITDKVYDRAMPINIDTKGVAFDAPLTDPVYISYKHFEYILNAAKVQFVVSEENLKKIALLDDYVIEHFRIAFGNRIVKQLRDFVPAYVGTGGTELDGLDYVLARKVFRKFESLNLSYIRDEIDGLCAYIDELFGEENMTESKDYLRMLKKLV